MCVLEVFSYFVTDRLVRMNYQHYQAYGATHYPQYTPSHYAQYQPAQTATIPTAPTATATTSTTTTAPLSRQPTQTANEPEQNADISTLNDAVGSAGLDLRVRFPESILKFSYLLMQDSRRRRRHFNGLRITTALIEVTKIDLEDSPVVQHLTRAFWGQRCVLSARNIKYLGYQKIRSITLLWPCARDYRL